MGADSVHAVFCQQIDGIVRAEIFIDGTAGGFIISCTPARTALSTASGVILPSTTAAHMTCAELSPTSRPTLSHCSWTSERTERIKSVINITDNSHHFSPPFKKLSIPRQAFSQYSASSSLKFASRRDDLCIFRLCCLNEFFKRISSFGSSFP